MAKDSQRPPPSYRDVSPCKGCEEKFLACHDRCPKDLRGEFGYNAWKNYNEGINNNRTAYKNRRRRMWK